MTAEPAGAAARGMACAVCGLVLHRRTETTVDGATTESWMHYAPVDHLTVPVSVADIRANFRCDFCMADHARWTLPVERYEVFPGNMNDGDWAACDDCSALLRTGDWVGLATRAHRIFNRSNPSASRQAFQQIYQQLAGHITGPVRLLVQVQA